MPQELLESIALTSPVSLVQLNGSALQKFRVTCFGPVAQHSGARNSPCRLPSPFVFLSSLIGIDPASPLTGSALLGVHFLFIKINAGYVLSSLSRQSLK
jgi:hypothetical protein